MAETHFEDTVTLSITALFLDRSYFIQFSSAVAILHHFSLHHPRLNPPNQFNTVTLRDGAESRKHFGKHLISLEIHRDLLTDPPLLPKAVNLSSL